MIIETKHMMEHELSRSLVVSEGQDLYFAGESENKGGCRDRENDFLRLNGDSIAPVYWNGMGGQGSVGKNSGFWNKRRRNENFPYAPGSLVDIGNGYPARQGDWGNLRELTGTI